MIAQRRWFHSHWRGRPRPERLKKDLEEMALTELWAARDLYISTLRDFVTAMGGTLEIRACFPDGEVRITQFKELEEQTL